MKENLDSLFKKLNDHTFYKRSASGNDFIVILNFEDKFTFEEKSLLAKKLCRTKFSVSADVLIFLEKPRNSKASFSWNFLILMEVKLRCVGMEQDAWQGWLKNLIFLKVLFILKQRLVLFMLRLKGKE